MAYPSDGANPSIAKQGSILDLPIAKITGLSGSLIWTGDRGQIVRDVKVGTGLAGGTIEGMGPDSWFELQFNDGSTVMISGTSMLTFSDAGQKELRLREGIFSANVTPQPAGKPMLIHTRSALLKVLGTQFDIKTNLNSTELNVREGKVRVKRLSDGREVDVPAKHRVVAGDEREMTPARVPDSTNKWKSQLDLGPTKAWGNYGKWIPASGGRRAAMKAIAFVPQENQKVTLHLLGLPVIQSEDSPVVVEPNSRFVVRGRIKVAAEVSFGIRMAHSNGEFAGKFLGRQEVSKSDDENEFELVYPLETFALAPCVRDRKDELPGSPEDLVLTGVWSFTYTGAPSGLEVTEVELLPPSSPAP
ncbi:MAG: FecR domain-containing protein [Mariniblastus sp.]